MHHSLYHLKSFCTPSSISTLCVHPSECSLLTSMTFSHGAVGLSTIGYAAVFLYADDVFEVYIQEQILRVTKVSPRRSLSWLKRTAYYAVHVITFVQQQFCHIRAILTCNARDEGNVLFAHKPIIFYVMCSSYTGVFTPLSMLCL